METVHTFNEFWPFYLRQHANPTCRALHFLGTGLAIAALALGVLLSAWWLVGAPLAGYLFAWVGHFVFEKNRPATFRYPLWSLAADFRMFWLMLAGRLSSELQRAGIR